MENDEKILGTVVCPDGTRFVYQVTVLSELDNDGKRSSNQMTNAIVEGRVEKKYREFVTNEIRKRTKEPDLLVLMGYYGRQT